MTDNSIITSAQNIVIAINNLVKATSNNYGTANSKTYTGGTTTQIVVGAGRLNNVTIIIPAAVNVDIYDAQSVSAMDSSNIIASVDATNSGTFVVNKIYTSGLVLDVGAGADANITYSPA